MLRPWVAEKVTELIKVEDDIVVEYVFGMLEDRDNPVRLNHTVLCTRTDGWICRRPTRRRCKFPS